MRFARALAAGLFALGACVTVPSGQERAAQADTLAAAHGWQRTSIPTDGFALAAYLPRQFVRDEALTVYMEGDGMAWIGPGQPSLDPTPRRAVGLEMALAQRDGNAAYLARPCQFIGDAAAGRCGHRYWTGQRFAPEVVASAGQALDALKARFGARRLTLVGYSGGGAIAALLAARRDDVERLVTVAGNLDHRAWTAHHRLTPLAGSLNPADFRDALARIPQLHFAGSEDRVIPPGLVEAFASGFAGGNRPEVRVVRGFDHACCWAQHWPRLLEEAR